MSCGCEQRNRLGRLGAVEKKLCAGSVVRVGFQLEFSLSPYFLNSLSEAVEGCLYQTGAFDLVTVQVTEGSFYVYVLVTATTAVDFAKAEDFGALVAGVINQCGGKRIGRRDPVQIDSGVEAEDCQARSVTDDIPVTQPGSGGGLLDSILPDGNSKGLLIVGAVLAAVLILKK